MGRVVWQSSVWKGDGVCLWSSPWELSPRLLFAELQILLKYNNTCWSLPDCPLLFSAWWCKILGPLTVMLGRGSYWIVAGKGSQARPPALGLDIASYIWLMVLLPSTPLLPLQALDGYSSVSHSAEPSSPSGLIIHSTLDFYFSCELLSFIT